MYQAGERLRAGYDAGNKEEQRRQERDEASPVQGSRGYRQPRGPEEQEAQQQTSNEGLPPLVDGGVSEAQH